MAGQEARPRHDHGAREQFAALLSGSVWPTVVMAVVATVVGALVDVQAAWSAALGGVLVLVFFSLSLVVMRQTAHLEPTLVMAVVLAAYTAKILALALALLLLHDASWVDSRALGLAVVVCTIVWLGFEMRAFTRLRTLVAPGIEDGIEDGSERGATTGTAA